MAPQPTFCAFSLSSRDKGLRLVHTIPHESTNQPITITVKDLQEIKTFHVPECINQKKTSDKSIKECYHNIYASFVHENHYTDRNIGYLVEQLDGKITRMARSVAIQSDVWETMQLDPMFANAIITKLIPHKITNIMSQEGEHMCLNCSQGYCTEAISSTPRIRVDNSNRQYYQYPFIVHCCDSDGCKYKINKTVVATDTAFAKNLNNNDICKSIFCISGCDEGCDLCDRCMSGTVSVPKDIYYNDRD